jgi:ATP-binding cassette subfamily B protein
MDTINHLRKDITILIIAHRVTTLKNCEKVIEIKDKRLSFVGVK